MKTPERAIVRVYACGIFSEPTFKSEMVNQALMWEEVLISDKKDNWYKIQLEHDRYQGWVNKMYLSFSKEAFDLKEKYPLFTVTNNFSYVPQPESLNGAVLSAGCRVPCTSFKRDPSFPLAKELKEISFLIFKYKPWEVDQYQIKEAKITSLGDLLFFNDESWSKFSTIELALEDELWFFNGLPYLWGGRSYMGYDCSGLIQTIFRLVHFDHDFPRDVKDQVNYSQLIEINSSDEIKPEDLLFFKKGSTVNHVAMATMHFNDPNWEEGDGNDLVKLPNDTIIHASGDKGTVCKESLKDSGLEDSLYKIMRHKLCIR